MTPGSGSSRWEGATLVVGHRGGRGAGWPPENTMAAFERACAEGARAVELDVRTSADGGVVVFHDEDLGRMTAGRDARNVADVRLAELTRCDLGGGATIPTLAEVLRWAGSQAVAVNVELKHDVPDRAALAAHAVRDVQASRADVLLSSFDPLLLLVAATRAPGLPRALLTEARAPAAIAVLQRILRPPLAEAIHVEHTASGARDPERYLRRGLRVGAWTVNDPEQARDLVRRGVATIITDRPGEMLRALG